MLDWLNVLVDLWLAAGILYFITGSLSAIFRRKSASGPSLWVLPFYVCWMLPLFLAISAVAGLWWLWDKLFKSGSK